MSEDTPCRRCGCNVIGGRCVDFACPFSDRDQGDPAGMIGAGIEPASELLPVLLAAVESIYQHAYDEHTPIDDIKADFDKMRSLASEAINKATKESIVTTATAWNGRCHRCGKETTGHIMSMFNHDLVCFDCKDEEVKRDDYAKAEAAEGDAVRKGNYNYGGIGLHGSGEEAP